MNADEFVDIDFEVSTCRSNELSDEEIVKIVLNEDNEDDDDDEIEAHDIPPEETKAVRVGRGLRIDGKMVFV